MRTKSTPPADHSPETHDDEPAKTEHAAHAPPVALNVEPEPVSDRPLDQAVAISLADEERRVAEARALEQAIARSQAEEDRRVAARHR